MPSIFWTGKLSPTLKLLVNVSNAIAWVSGNARDTAAMKERILNGYEGSSTDDVTRYDELGFGHYTAISEALLDGKSFQGQTVLDVGCGTGILSLLVLERGANKMVCGDLSEYMLSQCEKKVRSAGYLPSKITLRQLDADSLPFDNNAFDAVVSGMVFGLIPNQKSAVAEMVRVLKPGGTLYLSTHGPDLYFEAIEATFRAMPIGSVLGYRVEFWPRQEKYISRMFSKAGLTDVLTRHLTWKEQFADGGKAYGYFASTSAAWWYSKFPPDKIASLSRKIRNAFERNGIKELTTDVVLAYGRKP